MLGSTMMHMFCKSHCRAHIPAAYYVAHDHDVNALRIVIRGTSWIKDLLTDFKGVTAEFLSGASRAGLGLPAVCTLSFFVLVLPLQFV